MSPTTREPLVFENEGQKIFGIVHRPEQEGNAPAVAIFHGFLGSKDQPHRMFVDFAEALAEAGIVALRVDLRGRGDSEGDSLDITPRADLSDAHRTLDALAELRGADPERLALVGMSWGGLLAAMLAGQDARVKACALWSAVPTPTLDWSPNFQTYNGREAAENWGMLVGRQFYEHLRDLRPLDEAKNARCPLLVVYGTADDSVPSQDIERFRQVVESEPFDVIPIEGADHIFFSYRWKREVITQTVDWLKQVL
jgi:hypothetical protein